MVKKTPKPSFSLGRYKAWDPFAAPDVPPSSIAKASRKKLKPQPKTRPKAVVLPKPKPKARPKTEAVAKPKKKRKQYKSRLSVVVRVPNEVLPTVLALIDDFRLNGKPKVNPDNPDSY